MADGEKKTRWSFIGSLCETEGDGSTQPSARTEAYRLARAGNYDQAIERLDALTNSDPRSTSLWVVKGECLRATGRPEDALTCYSRALEIGPEGAFTEARILHVAGLALCSIHEYEQAVGCLVRSTGLDPSNAEAWKTLGIALRHGGAFDRAIAAQNHALCLQPNDADALAQLGFIHYQMGRIREALEHFDQALRFVHELPEAARPILAVDLLQAKADALEDSGHVDEALACIETAVQTYPDSPTAWAYHGRLLLNLERFAEAFTSLERSTRLDPTSAGAWQNKALSLKRLERHEDALESYDRAIALKPDLALSWLQKGEMLILHLNRVREGVPCVRRALQLNPQLGRRLAPVIMMLIRNPNL